MEGRGRGPNRDRRLFLATNVATPVESSAQLRKDLRACVIDGAAFSVMVGVGETYLPAFALAVGLSEVSAGLVASVPMLAGGVLQLVTPFGVRRFGSLRRWVVCCASVQALSFLPLIVFAAIGRAPAWVVFASAALYWGSGLATSPAWNTWMERLIPRSIRVPYFAQRTRIAHAFLLVGLLGGGLTLQAMTGPERHAAVFATLFAVAAAARLVSAGFLSTQSEPTQDLERHRPVSTRALFTDGRHAQNARLLLYLLAFQGAAQLAGPYFTPFMLGELQLTYAAYMTVLATSYLTKALALPLLGRMASRLGPLRLLWIGGLAITPLPALWAISQAVPYLLVLQVLGGLAWGAHELAMFLLFFEAIPEEDRPGLLTVFNLLNALALVVGALTGGALLKTWGEHLSSYHSLFLISTAGRAVALGLLFRILAGRPVSRPLAVRTLAVRPSMGSLESPILSSLPEANGVGGSPAPTESVGPSSPPSSPARSVGPGS